MRSLGDVGQELPRADCRKLRSSTQRDRSFPFDTSGFLRELPTLVEFSFVSEQISFMYGEEPED